MRLVSSTLGAAAAAAAAAAVCLAAATAVTPAGAEAPAFSALAGTYVVAVQTQGGDFPAALTIAPGVTPVPEPENPGTVEVPPAALRVNGTACGGQRNLVLVRWSDATASEPAPFGRALATIVGGRGGASLTALRAAGDFWAGVTFGGLQCGGPLVGFPPSTVFGLSVNAQRPTRWGAVTVPVGGKQAVFWVDERQAAVYVARGGPSTPGNGGATDATATPAPPPPTRPPTPTPTPTASPTPAPTRSPTATPTAGPSSTPDAGRDSCFPATARVALANGTAVAMHALTVGDAVRVSAAATHVSPVIAWSHRHPAAVSAFVALTHTRGVLTASPGHYVYANGARLTARSVAVGDVLPTADGGGARVTRVAAVTATGLYNAHTAHGDLVVDGVVVSTYTDAVHPAVAHALLAPVRAAVWAGVVDPLGGWLYERRPWASGVLPRGG